MANSTTQELPSSLRRKATDLRWFVDQVLRDRLATVDSPAEARHEIHAQAAVLRFMLARLAERAGEPLDAATVVVLTEHLSQDDA